MSCPDPHDLERALRGRTAAHQPGDDLSPSAGDELRDHVLHCGSCAKFGAQLTEVDQALGEPALWEGERAECLTARDVLSVLAGVPCGRDAHLEACAACRAELDGLEAALLERPAAVSPALRSRLRGLTADGSTVEERGTEAPSRRASGSGTSGRRKSGRRTARLRATGATRRTGRVSVPARASGVGPVSVRVLRGQRGPSIGQPAWAWATLAGAAGLLVVLAAALSPGPSRSQLAQGDLQGEGHAERTLVSDVLPRDRRASERPSAADVADPEVGAATRRSAAGPVTDRDRSPARYRADGRDARQPQRPQSDRPQLDRPQLDRPERDLPEAGRRDGEAVASDPSPQQDPTATGDESQTTERTRVRDAQPELAGRGPEAGPGTQSDEPRFRDDGGQLELALTHLVGSVQVLPREATSGADTEWRRLARRGGTLALRPGDRLRSRQGGFVSLDGGAFEVCLGKDSEVLVREAAGGPVLGLESGRLLAEVQSLAADRRFVVHTDRGTFSVLGTIFSVSTATEGADVAVVEGTVAVAPSAAPHAAPHKVGAGQALRIDGAGVSALRALLPGELAWARALAPRRQVVYSAGFEGRDLAGFSGEITTEHDPAGGHALLLSRLEGSKYWGWSAEVGKGRMSGFRPGPDVYVQFSFWSEDPAEVMFEAVNESQGKVFKHGFVHPGGGYWRTFTVPLLELTTYYDPGKNPVREGDLFVDLGVFAGKPGQEQRFLLDDVVIYRRVYR